MDRTVVDSSPMSVVSILGVISVTNQLPLILPGPITPLHFSVNLGVEGLSVHGPAPLVAGLKELGRDRHERNNQALPIIADNRIGLTQNHYYLDHRNLAIQTNTDLLSESHLRSGRSGSSSGCSCIEVRLTFSFARLLSQCELLTLASLAHFCLSCLRSLLK